MRLSPNITSTPMAPYQGLLKSMNRKEKMAVAMFLVDSLPGVETVESKEDVEMSREDEAFLSQKMDEKTYSPRIERLFEKRREAARLVELDDERTRHILGLR